MGYLSQKKHQFRENLLLNITSMILTFFTLFSLTNTNFDIIFPNLFQLYVLSFLMFIYSAIVKKYKVCLIFVMLFIINYTALSSSCNIFLSDFYDGNKKIELTFDNKPDITGKFNNAKINKGALVFENNVIAPYIKIENENPMMIIKINLHDTTAKLRKKILKQLAHFITKQDNPVILFGNFGIPAWNRYLRRFMIQTRLTVKNKILFTDNSLSKFLSLPDFYILGFNNMGIDNIKVSDDSDKNIKFDILF